MIGKPSPELDVEQWIVGKPVDLSKLKGKVVVLHFWSYFWEVGNNNVEDKRDLETVRFLNALQRAYTDKGVIFVSIHGYTQKIDELKKLVKGQNPAYNISIDKKSPSWHIPEERSFATTAQLGLEMIRHAKANGMQFEIVGCDTLLEIPTNTSGKRGRHFSRMQVPNDNQSESSRPVSVCSLAEKMTLTRVEAIQLVIKHLVNRSHSTSCRLKAQRRVYNQNNDT